MPVKRHNTITKQDFEDALDYMGASISQVAQGSGIPRAYLSDLKNRNIRLRRECEEKLRAYLSAQGVELEGDAPAIPDAPRAPHPSLNVETATRCYLPFSDALDDDAIERAMDALEENEARLVTLLNLEEAQQEVGRDSRPAYLRKRSGERDKNSGEALQEVENLLIENCMLIYMLRGWRGLRTTAVNPEQKTLRDVLIEKHKAKLIAVGLVDDAPDQDERNGLEDAA